MKAERPSAMSTKMSRWKIPCDPQSGDVAQAVAAEENVAAKDQAEKGAKNATTREMFPARLSSNDGASRKNEARTRKLGVCNRRKMLCVVEEDPDTAMHAD